MELYNGQLKKQQFNIVKKHGSSSKKSGKVYKTNNKCFDIFTFDVENTNGWIDDNGCVIPYEKGHNDEYWNTKTPVSLVYEWTFGINDTMYYGRDIIDFLKVLDDLPTVDMIVWCHNFSHEYCFLLNILTVGDVFARSPHSPIKCIFKEYPHIEFRCTYALTNLSLDNWGKQIGFYKKTGDLNYDLIRTPLTPFDDEKELTYCEYDCLVVYHGILEELKTYKTVFDIPLTSTGKIRKIIKEILFEDRTYSRYIKGLVPDIDEYMLLKKCFSGGVCHCNRLHSGHTIESDYISHRDFCSSYPTVLLCEKYPCSPFKKCQKKFIRTESKARDNYAFIYTLTFKNIRSTNPNTYIQRNKITYTGNIELDNGRVINCDGKLTITCTDIDFDIISWLYEWDYVDVRECYYAKKSYLPRAFLDYILTLYKDKTELKDVDGMESFYQLQKGRLNSLYGMAVTSLIPVSCEWVNDSWVTKTPSITETVEKLEKMADTSKSYNHEYFLAWSWGVFCTCWGRKNLYMCILGIDENGVDHNETHHGYDTIYYDTDSTFTIGETSYEWYDKMIDEKMKKVCKEMKLDFNKTRPFDKHGIMHPLGHFTEEKPIKKFRCLHAKCYIEQRFDDKLYMTISGINKGACACLDSIEDFKNGFVFDKDNKNVHKLIPTYCTHQPEIVYPDGYVSKYKYGKVLRPTGYKISVTDEYTSMINAYQLKIGELTKQQILTFRNGVI